MKSAPRHTPNRVCALLLALVAMAAAGSVLAQGTAPPPQGAPPPPQGGAQDQNLPPPEKLYSNEQLEQMMAPIALYPDSLLSQILMACTYPGSVAEAAAWSAQHKDAKGDDAVKMVEDQQWDPSVQSLVAFPQVLAQLKDQPDWVQKTGDAFLAQPKDVMDSIQRLRAKAQKAGNLKSNEQQKVIVQQAPPPEQGAATTTSSSNTTIIQIEPTNPQTVYVPAYNSTVVYGSWAYPSYPPPYWPPPPYYYPMGGALAAGLMFGAGIAITNSLWGGCNWGGGSVNINTNRYNNINVNNRINGGGNQNWNHNGNNRRGTPYADNRSRQQFSQNNRGGAANRDAYRGRSGTGTGDARRQNAAQSFNQSVGNKGGSNFGGRSEYGGNRAGGTAANRGAGSAAANRGTGNVGGGAAANRSASASAANRSAGAGNRSASSAGAGNRGASSNAFSGAQTRNSGQAASRGQQSFNSSRGSHGGGGGKQVSRSAPSRGGGGGGGRRR